jgi:hypothetical protein
MKKRFFFSNNSFISMYSRSRCARSILILLLVCTLDLDVLDQICWYRLAQVCQNPIWDKTEWCLALTDSDNQFLTWWLVCIPPNFMC